MMKDPDGSSRRDRAQTTDQILRGTDAGESVRFASAAPFCCGTIGAATGGGAAMKASPADVGCTCGARSCRLRKQDGGGDGGQQCAGRVPARRRLVMAAHRRPYLRARASTHARSTPGS